MPAVMTYMREGEKGVTLRSARIQIPMDRKVTRLLDAWREGEASAIDDLTGVVYQELRRIAAGILRRERQGHTLQPTALVHEAWMRLAGGAAVPSEDRTHFYAIAGRLMRQILIEHARRKHAIKRGGARERVTVGDGLSGPTGAREVLALDDALKSLEKLDPRKSQLVEMRYFGGLTSEEMAGELGISTRTVERDLKVAHAWLYRELNQREAE